MPEMEWKCNQYIVGFFDILGQSDQLERLDGVITDPKELERRTTNLLEAAVVPAFMRYMFTFRAEEVPDVPTGLEARTPKDMRLGVYDGALTTKAVRCWGVGDSVVVAIPVTREQHPAGALVDMCGMPRHGYNRLVCIIGPGPRHSWWD